MAPKDDKGPVATLVDVEKWPTISGDAAERDFLYVVEVFCKWCGPSEAIISTFRRVLMDYSKRKLKFVQIEATEEIPELARLTLPPAANDGGDDPGELASLRPGGRSDLRGGRGCGGRG